MSDKSTPPKEVQGQDLPEAEPLVPITRSESSQECEVGAGKFCSNPQKCPSQHVHTCADKVDPIPPVGPKEPSTTNVSTSMTSTGSTEQAVIPQDLIEATKRDAETRSEVEEKEVTEDPRRRPKQHRNAMTRMRMRSGKDQHHTRQVLQPRSLPRPDMGLNLEEVSEHLNCDNISSFMSRWGFRRAMCT